MGPVGMDMGLCNFDTRSFIVVYPCCSWALTRCACWGCRCTGNEGHLHGGLEGASALGLLLKVGRWVLCNGERRCSRVKSGLEALLVLFLGLFEVHVGVHPAW